MTEKDNGKGNLLISYLFQGNDICTNLQYETEMKRDLQELVENWKRKGFIRRYVIADDELI